MSNSYDIIIIGAGPAGTSAALYAHKLGLNTVIIDKSTFPRDKILEMLCLEKVYAIQRARYFRSI